MVQGIAPMMALATSPGVLAARSMHTRDTSVASNKEIAHVLGKLGNLTKLLRSAEHQTDRKEAISLTYNQLMILLAIARQPGITQKELANETGQSPSAVQRNCATLGDKHALSDREGLRLVETVQDPVDNRRMIQFLTPKGRRFMEQVVSTMMPGEVVNLEATTAAEFLNKRSGRR